MTDKEKETIVAAIGKAAGAMGAQEAALLAGDQEEFERQRAEYCRYCEVFGRVMGMSEDQFDSLVLDFRERQSSSE